MSLGARTFVAINFIVLGLSFVATTVALFVEFGWESNADWTALATYYSHLFIFFPTFGILALIAFFVPSSILVDIYWHYVPNGKVRFSIGYIVAILLALIVGAILGGGGGLKSMFEIKPSVLLSDRGDPADCGEPGRRPCLRAPILRALEDVRHQAMKRAGMSKFVRECSPDPLIGSHPERESRRYCFVTQTLVDAESCCKAQQRFAEKLSDLHSVVENRSITGTVHRYLLPFKVFFLLIVFTIAILLVIRHRLLEEHYAPYLRKLQRGVLIGAFAMLVWPLMNLAFLQSSGLLYGSGFESIYRDASPLILAAYVLWVLLLVFFFFKSYDRADRDMENMGRIAGIVGSAVAAANYETVIDYSVRLAGSGATWWSLGGLFLIVVVAFIAVIMQPRRSPTEGLNFDK
jgi:hypothetical protein